MIKEENCGTECEETEYSLENNQTYLEITNLTTSTRYLVRIYLMLFLNTDSQINKRTNRQTDRQIDR